MKFRRYASPALLIASVLAVEAATWQLIQATARMTDLFAQNGIAYAVGAFNSLPSWAWMLALSVANGAAAAAMVRRDYRVRPWGPLIHLTAWGLVLGVWYYLAIFQAFDALFGTGG